MDPGFEPIDDDEILLRRIPVRPEYFNPNVDAHPTPLAFRPRESDASGLSVFREKYTSPEAVAQNPRGKRYFVASLRAGTLRSYGLVIEARPLPGEPGHAEIANLTAENKKTKWAREMQMLLAEKLCVRVDGPFP